MHFAGFVVMNIALSIVIHPMLMHWTWNKGGWMQSKEIFRSKLTLTDNFGCLAIHIYAGTVALIGGLFFGGRLILLEEISEMSIGLESPGNSIMGYVFIIIGLISFIPPGIKPELTLINNLMALGSGVISVSVLQFLFCKQAVTYWTMLKCMQGAIAGIITVAGGVHLYSSLTVLLMALCGSGIFYVVQITLHNNFLIEDYCNVVTLHLICGVLGLAFSPLIIMQDVKSLVVFLWYLICILASLVFLAVTTTILFFLLLITATLRNDSEEINHERSLVLANKSKNRKCLQRLFHGDLNIPQIEPGSRKNVGLDAAVSKQAQNTQNIGKTTEKHASLVVEVCVNKQSVSVEPTAYLTNWYVKGQYSYTFDKAFNNYRWYHTYKLVNDEYSRFISIK
ncbi:hypothetical protein RI129_004171 [Pyrocoelia pectoralis]|uniref:Ammonium transporter AmtB-like domain-containing protein n=1 Tax=Pyrocoelia pectoralis TaxID=417401 RepID=A0AAN7ZJ20_9COLE